VSQADLSIARYENVSTNARTRLDFRLAHVGSTGAPDATVMSLLSSGAVGIGTTSPSHELDIQAAGNSRIKVKNTSVTGETQFHHDGNGDLNIVNTGTGDSIRLFTESTERARIDSSGRLLVGTSSAFSNTQALTTFITPKFQLNGAGADGGSFLVRRTDGPPYLNLANGSSVSDGSLIGTINFQGYDGTNHLSGARIQAVVDGTPGTDDMPGRLVFSTTKDGASSPVERMRIENTGVMRHLSNDVSGGSGYVVLHTESAGTSTSLIQGVHSATTVLNGTVSFRVFTNGNVQNTNNSYGSISDIKLKENIVDANSQWDDLKALQVRNYNFKEGQTHTQIGLVAQEVELVSPGLVSESPDRDEENNDLGTVTKSVNYSVLYMKAVKALQEAMERIETLEAKVAALEAV